MSIQKVREALEPFAKGADQFDAMPVDDPQERHYLPYGLTQADLRRARAALALLDDLATVDERALQAAKRYASERLLVKTRGAPNDFAWRDERAREQIHGVAGDAITAYLSALTETKR